MATRTPKSDLTTVSCPCGASMEIDLSQPSPVTVCPDCGQMLEVLVTVDPKTRVKRIGILVKAAAVAPRHSKTKIALSGGKGTATTEEVHTAKCTCGAQLTITPKSPDTIFTCSACDAQFTASLKGGKGTAAPVLVLRPVAALPVTKARVRPAPVSDTRRMKLQKAKAAAPPSEEAAPPPNPAAKEKLLLMAKGDIGAQEIVTSEEEGSSVACYCGEALPLRGEYHREILKCRECGMAFRVFAATHPKTGASMAVMIPRDSGK